MKKKDVTLPSGVCPVVWIIENQDKVIGCGFNVTDVMMGKLLIEAAEYGDYNFSRNRKNLRMFIPANLNIEGDNDAEIIFRKVENNGGWDIADINSVDISRRSEKSRRSVLFNNDSKGKIHFNNNVYARVSKIEDELNEYESFSQGAADAITVRSDLVDGYVPVSTRIQDLEKEHEMLTNR